MNCIYGGMTPWMLIEIIGCVIVFAFVTLVLSFIIKELFNKMRDKIAVVISGSLCLFILYTILYYTVGFDEFGTYILFNCIVGYYVMIPVTR